MRRALSLILFAASIGCAFSPTMRAHYMSAPFRSIAHAQGAIYCDVSPEHGIMVLAIPPAVCPPMEAIDFAASRVIKLVPGADALSVAGARITYTANLIDCTEAEKVKGFHFSVGCTLGDEMVVQDHAGLGWGFALKTTEHELGHALRYRLGMADFVGIDGRHEPSMWWERIDGVPEEEW